MRWLDTLCAWVLVALGSAHFLAVWIPRLAVVRGPWAGGAAAAIVSMGLMNAVRSQRSSDAFLRWSTVAATALTAGLCLQLLYAFPGNVLHQPAALATTVLAIVELAFGVLG